MKKTLSYTFLLLFTLIVIEGTLQLAAAISKPVNYSLTSSWIRNSVTLPDEKMGRKGNPIRLDHDKRGYRNAKALDTADIVTLGDSHTHGAAVPRDETWPHLIANHSVYNMGLGGYGQLHNYLQLDEALELSPKLVILGIYFGNDFADNFKLSFSKPELNHWLGQERMQQLTPMEANDPLEAKLNTLFNLGANEPESEHNLRTWISNNLKTYALIRALKNALEAKPASADAGMLATEFANAKAAISDRQRPYVSFLETEQWKTILTAPYRSKVVDDSEVRIRAGFEIGLDLVGAIHSRLEKEKIRLLVVFMPTKENVAWPHVSNPNAHPDLAELVSNEARLKNEIIAKLDNLDIPYLDPASVLSQHQPQTYAESVDGHPSSEGHKVIAGQINQWLEKNQL